MNPDEKVTYFGATDSRGRRVPFGIKAKDRTRHMYVIGKTGMGKSTLLENLAIQDIQNGEGLAFIDPHGGTAEKLLEYVPQHRINDVVYFAPFDLEQPIAFNVMEDVGYDKRHLVVSGLMATFKKIWQDAWSARMEYILSNTLLALLEYPGSTLLGVNRMYTDKVYRKKVIDNVKDPVVKDFWTKEFANYTDRFTQEATPAIQNKIGQFTSNPLIRNIIGQPKSSFDFRDLMDRKKIVIVNLSKGLVGEVNMRLLGSMITTRIFLAAMSRAELSKSSIDQLPPFYFYVDEFQNFANETFAEILSEARKYKLGLIVAHQYVEQMEDEVKAAVFGNVGTTIAFRVGPFDAEVLETIFSPEFMKEDLVNLGFAQTYLTLMIDGVGSRPFSATTIPPIEPPQHIFKSEVIEASRKNYGGPRAQIEEALIQELTAMPDPEEDQPQKPERREQRNDRSPQRSGQGSNQNHYQNQGQQQQRAPRPEQSRAPRPSHQDEQRPPRTNEQRTQSSQPMSHSSHNYHKSADDLKAVLRSMMEQNAQSKPAQPKKPEPAPDLKNALSEVMHKQTTQDSGPKPFEVPEDVLRSIFKDQ